MCAKERMSPAEKKMHFRNVATMAFRDGKLQEPEKALLHFVAKELGLTAADVADVAAHPKDLMFVAPKNLEARFGQLYDLTEMMIADGVVKADEKKLCLALAGQLQFEDAAVDTIIRVILEGNRSYLQPSSIREKALKELKARNLVKPG